MGHAVVRAAKAVRGTVRSGKSESSCEGHRPCHGGAPDPYLEGFFFNFVYNLEAVGFSLSSGLRE